MSRSAAWLAALVLAFAVACDDVPNSDITATPEPAPTPPGSPTPTPTPTPTPGPTSTPTPSPTPTPTPDPTGEVRFEVTGTSCGGTVRWSVGASGNGNGTPETYPWSLTRTGRTGDRVNLRACSNQCGNDHEVTVTATIFWRGVPIATRSRTDDTRAGHCQPSSSVDGNLP